VRNMWTVHWNGNCLYRLYKTRLSTVIQNMDHSNPVELLDMFSEYLQYLESEWNSLHKYILAPLIKLAHLVIVMSYFSKRV